MSSSKPSPRPVTVAACQLGPIHLADSRDDVLQRMLSLLDQSAEQGAKLAVFPELAFTTFFPRYLLEEKELDQYFDVEDPKKGGIEQSPSVKPLFDYARSLGIDVYVGYAERSPQQDGSHIDYNSCVYYSAQADRVVGKYRKVHLPGTVEPHTEPGAFQQLEKRYFRPGDLGFPAFRAPGLVEGALKKSDARRSPAETAGRGDPIVGMLICNDRRWAEAWRVYASGHKLDMSDEEAEAMGNSYMNACFSINVAKTGAEDGHPLVGGTMIVHPLGHIIKEATTKEDELVVATIDLADCHRPKNTVFAFEKHRRTEHYHKILQQTGVVEPELL
ncbi:hypothetical protein N7468_002561 [Penicillium chermesinum]|uniref:CN hydrolase domain-containing protein n=1 Tax=Penicillium chermesinum TaxID=63820 RepID=A0A9W9PIR9_9EURO|nr:uncharacterized protein N7468_002561 [Penicillium chermesinum]KAJ5247578.1 hypothetical protein N7468_002561 [Penicillium chermesinum]